MSATMEPLVDCVIEEPRWEVLGLAPRAEAAARAALADRGLPAEGFVISVLGCDDSRIAALNAQFRSRGGPTNVLSWPSQDRRPAAPGALPAAPTPGPADDPAELGDIAIAWGTCAREAEGQGKTLPDHVSHLIVHATLHLLGYDHVTPQDAALMEAAEIAALARLGISDPY
jgi:probable rRNA maturation factor